MKNIYYIHTPNFSYSADTSGSNSGEKTKWICTFRNCSHLCSDLFLEGFGKTLQEITFFGEVSDDLKTKLGTKKYKHIKTNFY